MSEPSLNRSPHRGWRKESQAASRHPDCRRPAASFPRRALVALAIILAVGLPVFPAPIQSEPASAVPSAQQAPHTLPDLNADTKSPLTPKQQRELMKSNFEKMKRDADELAELAKSLQQDLDKSNQNVLSLKVLDRAEKIEKLARKIKNEAKAE